MKITSYNVNGIRSAMSKGLLDWIGENTFDIVCLQEVKANYDQINPLLFSEMGYHVYWCSARKKGYSGVAVLTRIKPRHVEIGTGHRESDEEGRVIRLDFDNFSVMNVYVPSGTTGGIRQDFKMTWLAYFHEYVQKLREQIPNLVIGGDFNICHRPIDIHNPVANKNSSGFLPEEREWLTQFLDAGFIDTFRHFCEDPHRYSWWSYRAGSRSRNLGWRIDYLMASSTLASRLQNADIFDQVVHSDHCPVYLELN